MLLRVWHDIGIGINIALALTLLLLVAEASLLWSLFAYFPTDQGFVAVPPMNNIRRSTWLVYPQGL